MLGFRLFWVPSFLVLSAVQIDVIRAQSSNITLTSTAPQIIWSPALCNMSLTDVNCSSAWRVADDIPGIEVTSTNGPDPATGDIIPQMFLSFRASAIYIRTSPLSIATANVTISSTTLKPLYLDTQVDSSIGWISADGLPEDRILTLGITYVPDSDGQNGDGGRFDIQFVTMSVANTSVTSSFLPSMTLPATRTPPIFSNSQTPTTAPARSQSKGVIIGESLGPALGVLLFASAWAAVILRRRRMRNMRIEASERHWGDYERGRHTQRAQDREASKWF